MTPIAVADHQRPQQGTEAKEQEPVLRLGMVWISQKEGLIIREDRLCFLERNAVLGLVGAILGLVPIEAEVAHLCQCNYKVGQPGSPTVRAALR